MTESHPHQDADRPVRSWSVIWNTVVPGLAVALLLGASVLPAVAIAAIASIAITFVLAATTRAAQPRPSRSPVARWR